MGGPTDPNMRDLPPGRPVDPYDQTIASNPLPPYDPTTTTPDREALRMHSVHFDLDSSVVKSSDKANIAAVAAYLSSNIRDGLLVEGHCDERGTEEYNRSLGSRRALAIREALVAIGADPNRITTATFGEDNPIATGNDESAWAQNRRGEFVVLHPK